MAVSGTPSALIGYQLNIVCTSIKFMAVSETENSCLKLSEASLGWGDHEGTPEGLFLTFVLMFCLNFSALSKPKHLLSFC